jgi:hypothetical protein
MVGKLSNAEAAGRGYAGLIEFAVLQQYGPILNRNFVYIIPTEVSP